MMPIVCRSIAAVCVMILVSACSQRGQEAHDSAPAVHSATDATQNSPFIVTATVKELMDSTVDPSADALWDSVAIIYSLTGVDDRHPRTDEEWKAVRRNAITLVESTNLLVMDGRHAAPKGTQPGVGELAPEQIDERIAASRPAFVQFAHGLRAAAMKALDAIDKKDPAALLESGGDIDQACETCHVTYWYPNQGIPTG